jgi:hypothetical protein
MPQVLAGSRRASLVVLGLFAGSIVTGVVFAGPDPAPGIPLPVREQNLDASGWIKVHEQGTSQVTGSIEVANFPASMEISNFPQTQDVNVVGGQLDLALAPISIGFSEQRCASAGNHSTTALPATINATDVTISNYARAEVGVHLHSPIAMYGSGYVGFGPSVFSYQDFDGDTNGAHHSFARPVPIDSVTVQCMNEDFDCCVQIDIVGVE